MGFANCELPMMSHNVIVLAAALLCAINVTATYHDITAPTTYEGAARVVWDTFADDRRAGNASNGTNAPTSAPTVKVGSAVVAFTVSLSDTSLAQFEEPAFVPAYKKTLATTLTKATGVTVSDSQIYAVKAVALRRAGISVSQKISLPPGTATATADTFATKTTTALKSADFTTDLSTNVGFPVGTVTVTSAPSVSYVTAATSSSGMSTGVIVLIVIVVVVAVVACAVGVYCFMTKNSQEKSVKGVVV